MPCGRWVLHLKLEPKLFNIGPGGQDTATPQTKLNKFVD